MSAPQATEQCTVLRDEHPYKLYQHADGAVSITAAAAATGSVTDLLTAKTQQLAALLALTNGAPMGDGFNSYSEPVRDSVLWLAHTLAEEVNVLALATSSGGRADQ